MKIISGIGFPQSTPILLGLLLMKINSGTGFTQSASIPFGLLLVKIISGNWFWGVYRVQESWKHVHIVFSDFFPNFFPIFFPKIYPNISLNMFSENLSMWNSREISLNTVNTTNAAWNSVKFCEIRFLCFLTKLIDISENFTEFHGISRYHWNMSSTTLWKWFIHK